MKKNKFDIKREETYNRLIGIGMEVFLTKGYSKTTIDDIAKAAGYTRGAFYFHFDSKEDYFMHLMRLQDERRGADWMKLPYQFDPDQTSLAEVLKYSLNSLFDKVYDQPMSGWIFVVFDFYQSSKDDPTIKVELKELHQRWEEDVATFVVSLQDQGYVSTALDPGETALRFIMLTYGYMITFYMYDKKDMDLLFQSYLKILT